MITHEGRDITTSTCRHCWEPILSAAGTGRPLWVHTGTRRAGCEGGPLPIAEPNTAAPAVQGTLFDLPPSRLRGGRPAAAVPALGVVMPWAVSHHHPLPHSGSGSGLLATFVHSLVASLGWHAGASVAHLLGGWLLVVTVLVVLGYLVHRVRVRVRSARRRLSRGGRRWS